MSFALSQLKKDDELYISEDAIACCCMKPGSDGFFTQNVVYPDSPDVTQYVCVYTLSVSTSHR